MIPNYRVLALDPGGTTGWSRYDALYLPDPENDGELELVEAEWHFGHIGPHEHHLELDNFLGEMHIHNFELVWESFEFRQGKQRENINLMSREYIGVAKRFVQERHVQAYSQTAGTGKGFVDDNKLRVMGLYHSGWKHANDATRHLVYHLVNRKKRYDLIESWRRLA